MTRRLPSPMACPPSPISSEARRSKCLSMSGMVSYRQSQLSRKITIQLSAIEQLYRSTFTNDYSQKIDFYIRRIYHHTAFTYSNSYLSTAALRSPSLASQSRRYQTGVSTPTNIWYVLRCIVNVLLTSSESLTNEPQDNLIEGVKGQTSPKFPGVEVPVSKRSAVSAYPDFH